MQGQSCKTGTAECCKAQSHLPLWKKKLFVLTLIYFAVFYFGNFVGSVLPLSRALWMYVGVIAFPVSLGLLIGGLIDWLVPPEYISQVLAQKRKRTVPYAVVSGFFMSACCHGILAIAIQLYKKGASTSSVVAFLLASPWANLPLTMIMFGFFGVKALFLIFGAVVIALISGYIFMFLEGRKLVDINPNTVEVENSFSVFKDVAQRLSKVKVGLLPAAAGARAVWKGSLALSDMVLWWIMLGALLSSLTAAYVPAHFVHQYMGPTVMGLLATLLLATVIEICSEGSAPLAFEIYRQTGALGNSFVFLMAGVATDYTEIGLLWANIGWRTALWLPAVAVPQTIILGLIANRFL